MKLYVGVTDYDWYRLHAWKATVEVNLWRPSPDASFKVLAVGEPFLFRLHPPRNYIAGGGFFRKFPHELNTMNLWGGADGPQGG